MRLFVACCVDTAAATRLHAALEPARTRYRGGAYRWTPPVSYHVTLRFFGELAQDVVERIAECVRPIADRAAPIDCSASRLLALPGERRPAVVAVAIESKGRVEALAAQLNAAFDAQFGKPDKSFKAHLTVIRCRRGARFTAPVDSVDVRFGITDVALFESAASNDGPRYTPLRTFRLGGDQVSPS